MTSDELPLRSALEQAALVRGGQVSAGELVEASLEAIDRLDGGLGAFVTLAEDRARAEAAGIRPGDERPLAGVPLAVKDILALTGGIRTTFGMRAMENWVPRSDSATVRRLRAAGAIVIGKTSTPELGILPVTEPARFGATRTPWDTSRTAGGSSGGSAAAVAAGMVALAYGNDGGGSIRIPASCCGLVGLRPSRGRSSLAPGPNDAMGIVAEGSLTRTVADTALFLDVIAGTEPGDPWVAPAPTSSFLAAAAREPARLRIGFSASAPGGVPVHPDCETAMDDAAGLLAALGHEVVEAAPSWGDERTPGHFVRAWTSRIPGAVANCAALRGRPVADHELEPLTRAMCESARATSAPELVDSINHLRGAARRTARFWDDHDVLLTPTLAQPPLPVGALDPSPGEAPLTMLDRATEFTPFTATWNVTGQPALSLPLHISDAGLPIGVQLVGPPYGEELLLALAGQLEGARPWPRVSPATVAG